jgi:hypothetical protein
MFASCQTSPPDRAIENVNAWPKAPASQASGHGTPAAASVGRRAVRSVPRVEAG